MDEVNSSPTATGPSSKEEDEEEITSRSNKNQDQNKNNACSDSNCKACDSKRLIEAVYIIHVRLFILCNK